MLKDDATYKDRGRGPGQGPLPSEKGAEGR